MVPGVVDGALCLNVGSGIVGDPPSRFNGTVKGFKSEPLGPAAMSAG